MADNPGGLPFFVSIRYIFRPSVARRDELFYRGIESDLFPI